MIRKCRIHGEVRFWRSGQYWRCSQCSVQKVNDFRRRRKLEIIEQLGGRCARCGYDKSPAALVCHHKDSTQKHPRLKSRRTGTAATYLSKELFERERPNLELLCANCHAEEHWSYD